MRRTARIREATGFSSLEIILSIALTSIAIAATSAMFLAGKGHVVMKGREVETTQAARAALDVLVRDLRLGGACLPVTGEFISLEGVDSNEQDEITTRTGLTRPDLSCIRSATTGMTTSSDPTILVENSQGFEAGMRGYIRHPNGTGEYFDIVAVSNSTSIVRAGVLSIDYPPTSGIYAIDERRFFLSTFTKPSGDIVPQLMVQIGANDPTSFAVGVEELDVGYRLRSNCNPDCDVVDLPADNSEWQLVDQVLLSITARSERTGPNGVYYRRKFQVAVKPRNILP